MLESPIIGVDETLDLAFNHQRGKLAVFLINYYSYGGGAMELAVIIILILI